jgi:hypothetical protein
MRRQRWQFEANVEKKPVRAAPRLTSPVFRNLIVRPGSGPPAWAYFRRSRWSSGGQVKPSLPSSAFPALFRRLLALSSVAMPVVPGAAELAAEQQLLNEELYHRAHAKVKGFIERLQAADSAQEYVELHRTLLAEFGARQDASEEVLPEIKSDAAAKIRALARQSPKPIPLITEQQQILDRVRRQERVARAVQHILREVGDGMAWRALRYDRKAFTILGDGQRVGRLAAGIGRDAEFAELGRLWEEEQTFAIHNDMTNCLRHGDLTAVRQTGTQIDVKAGASRDAAQLERLERATTLLREGRLIDGGNNGQPLQITVVPGVYETFLDALGPLVAKTRTQGYEWVRLHECVLVGAADYRVWGSEADRYNALSQARRAEIGWAPEKEETLAWMASLRRMRDRGESFSSIAPFTIYPLPPEDVVDIVFGFIDVVFCLDLQALDDALAVEGVDVETARPPLSTGLFLTARRDELTLTVPPHLREQMMVELMTPAALRRALTAVLDDMAANPSTAGDSRIVVFEDEASAWEPRR